MGASPTCSVVIPHLKGSRPLLACLQALHTTPDPPQILLVDNASHDGSVEQAVTAFPGIGVVTAPENLGYAGACNLGLGAATGSWCIFLNDDAVLAPGTLRRLVRRMEEDRDPATLILQPSLRSSGEPWRFDYAGAAGGLIDRWGYPFALGRLFDACEADEGQYAGEHALAWASGCCMIGATERFRSLGGFEDSFFAHFEEIDLCWRHRRMGGRIRSVPEGLVYHMGPSTLPAGARKTYLNFRNSLWTLRRNLPLARLTGVLFVRFLMDAAAALRFLFGGRAGEAFAVARGWVSGIAARPWGPVKPPPRESAPHDGAGTYGGSIVVARYLYGRRTATELRSRVEGWEEGTDAA